MRKFVVPSAWLLLCLLLAVFSDACLMATADALSAWWNRVLPALLPFSVFLSLSDSGGAFALLEHICRKPAKRLHISPALLPCMLFGMLSGYPNGARLSSLRGIGRNAAFCSFCSPVFLLGVVSYGLYGRGEVFLPLFAAHIGSGLLTVLPQCLFPKTRTARKSALSPSRHTARPQGFFPILRDSLSVMASVGGCMVLFSVGIALIRELHLLSPLAALRPFGWSEAELLALLHGCFEFAGGCVSIAALSLPLRIRLSMTAFTVGFGGLCVMLQSAMFLDTAETRQYGRIKLLQGVLAAVFCYLLFPVFCSDAVTALSSADQTIDYAANALSMGSMLAASGVVLFAFYLFALALGRFLGEKQHKNRPAV